MTQKHRVIRALEINEPDCVPIFEWDIKNKVINVFTGTDDILKLIDVMDLDGVVLRPEYSKEYIEKDEYIDDSHISHY